MTVPEVERMVLALTEGEADPAFRRRAAWVLSRLALRRGDRVLELGAGIAPVLALARHLGPVIGVGVDVDLARLAEARVRAVGVGLVVADAAALPFRVSAFDAVLATEVLEHLADDRPALRELRRCTASGGRVAVTVPNADYPMSWDPLAWVLDRIGVGPLRRGPYVGIWTGHERLYRRQDLRAAATECGWTVAEEAELVRGAFPFAHFLLYGLGRKLLLAGLLDRRAAAAVGRTGEPARLPPAWHPIGFAVRLLRLCDRRAERRAVSGSPSVHLAALLTAGGGPSR